MKSQVAAGVHPWIDDWNALIADPEAQNNWTPAPTTDFGANISRGDEDAHAAYLNALRWYVSGDTSYANCAVNILNAWSSTVTSNSDVGLSGITVYDFAIAAELLRTYSGWSAASLTQYQKMMENILYPNLHSFMINNAPSSSAPTSWCASNEGAILLIGVLCDDQAKYNEGVADFESAGGNGCITNAVWQLNGSIGQVSEAGRDQEHCTLGIAYLGEIAQIAWNQGLDLYGYNNNRLLAGIEYVAQYNLWQSVPFSPYNDTDDDSEFYISANGRGRIDDKPIYEMFYNHYAVLKGLSAPNTKAMAQLYRPEHGSHDLFGYGTLAYTLSASASPYPPSPTPPMPTGLTATPGIGQVYLSWNPSSGNTAQGFNVLRSTSANGTFANIATLNQNTGPQYTDTTVINGTTYYYKVSAINQSGTSSVTSSVGAGPQAGGALPPGWSRADISSSGGSSKYSLQGNNTFVLTGNGTGWGNTGPDSFSYLCEPVTGDCTITVRILNPVYPVGLMMRENLGTAATLVDCYLGGYYQREALWAVRNGTGANLDNYLGGNQFTYAPVWFRMQRTGNVFIESQSPDGVNWFQMSDSSISTTPMASSYYVGLAVASGTATFDNLTVTGGGAVPLGRGMFVSRADGNYIDNKGATTNGQPVGQSPQSNSTNLQWIVTYNGSNSQYRLMCVTGSEYLDSLGNSGNSTQVGQWALSSSVHQLWKFTSVAPYWKITNVSNGECVDTGGLTTAGSILQFWGSGTSNNQQWSFVPGP